MGRTKGASAECPGLYVILRCRSLAVLAQLKASHDPIRAVSAVAAELEPTRTGELS